MPFRSIAVILTVATSVATADTSRQSSLRAVNAMATLQFVPGSAVKVAQLIGEEDKQRHQVTLSRTVSRYGLEGADLGYSFEHDGRAFFLFGDTVGDQGRALDSIGTTDVRDPNAGVRLDFLTAPTQTTARRGDGRGRGRARGLASPRGDDGYLTVQPPGVSMGAFEVPVSGISLNGQIYVVVTTNHSDDRSTDRSVLTKFTPPAAFQTLRTISQRPAGRFIKMSLHAETARLPGLPSGGPFVFIWGTSAFRKSDAYLAIVPVSRFEQGQGTRYFAGLDTTGVPRWSDRESDSVPVATNGTMGDLSVTWCQDLQLWLMTYDSRRPAPQGIEFSYSPTPWGPWSEAQTIFNANRDGATGTFIHDPRASRPDGLVGPVIGQARANPDATGGAAYAPYVVERWTKRQSNELNIYYVLSTWNPYVVVLMTSRLKITGR